MLDRPDLYPKLVTDIIPASVYDRISMAAHTAVQQSSQCSAAGSVLVSLVTKPHRALLDFMFDMVQKDECLLRQVVLVCSGFSDTRYGTCVSTPHALSSDTSWSTRFKTIVWTKYFIVAAALRGARQVVWSDIDIVLLQNPFNVLKHAFHSAWWYMADVLYQYKHVNGCSAQLNSGFFVVGRAQRPMLEALVQPVLKYDMNSSTNFPDEQVAFDRLRKDFEPNCALPAHLFLAHKWVAHMLKKILRYTRYQIDHSSHLGILRYLPSMREVNISLCTAVAYHATTAYTRAQKAHLMGRVLRRAKLPDCSQMSPGSRSVQVDDINFLQNPMGMATWRQPWIH